MDGCFKIKCNLKKNCKRFRLKSKYKIHIQQHIKDECEYQIPKTENDE